MLINDVVCASGCSRVLAAQIIAYAPGAGLARWVAVARRFVQLEGVAK